MRANRSTNRKQEILESLVVMLQDQPCSRITTAALSKQVGVSEAALYRHFPSKARMFQELLDYVGEVLFQRVAEIQNSASGTPDSIARVLELFLAFLEKNPGISRLLVSDSLGGEDPRLAAQVSQLFERLETELRQFLRRGELEQGIRTRLPAGQTANLLIVILEGRLAQFVRSDFRKGPLENFEQVQELLVGMIFRAD